MSVIARFEVIPVRDGSMSTAIAAALRALDRHPVSYETTATDTIIEADTVDAVFAAVQAAHRAIPDDRVITSVEIDEDRRRPQDMHQRVASVERELGHPPQRSQQPPVQSAQSGPPSRSPSQSTGMQSSEAPAGPPQSTPRGQSSQGNPPGQSPSGGSSGRPMRSESQDRSSRDLSAGQATPHQPPR